MRTKTIRELTVMSDSDLIDYRNQLEKCIETLVENSLSDKEPRLQEYWVEHLDDLEEFMIGRRVEFNASI
jgi:hypothetical protein